MARLKYKARQHLPRSKFATPPTKSAKKRGAKGSYPVDTRNRAKNALSRSANKSPAVKAAVRAAVHKHFPGIKIAKKK